VNPANDTLENLVLFIVQYAGPFLAPAGIELLPESPENVPKRVLPANYAKNVFLAVEGGPEHVVKTSGRAVRLCITFDEPWLAIRHRGQRRGHGVNHASTPAPTG